MKTPSRFLSLLVAAALAAACNGKVNPDLPAPPQPEEKPEDKPVDVTPPEEEKETYPVDVREAFLEGGMIATLSDFKHETPHSGVDVSEIRYKDTAGNLQAVFVMQVDLSDKTVSMTNTVPGNTLGAFTGGREKLSAQFKRIDQTGHRVIGGINTDFFTTEAGANAGRPQGIFWHNGTCYKDSFNSQSTRPRCFVYWGKDEKVSLAKSADYLGIKVKGTLREAFSGGQFLVEKGKATDFTEDSVYGVHPRTMFGVTADPLRVVLVVLDGRKPSRAVGMNYPDMQKILLALGCETALNIDGGGSSTFIVRDMQSSGVGDNAVFQVRNNPSDGTERAIGPGLAIVISD